MDLDRNAISLPKDARWQDLIPQLKCPQCQMYQGSSISNLERHVILHCKCRPTLMKNHYIKKLKHLCARVHSAEEDVMDYVKLALEAKLLQWRQEGMPEIPLLLRQNDNQSAQKRESKNHSKLLDLWRLWHQEVDSVSLEFNTSDLLQLMMEAEGLEWEPCEDILPLLRHGDDHQLNKELMSEVEGKLKQMQSSSEEMNIEEDTIKRLENEARINDGWPSRLSVIN